MTNILSSPDVSPSNIPAIPVAERSAPFADAKERPRFVSNLATVFGGQLACAALALGLETCYARLLGPVGRGQIGLAMMVVTLGVLLGGLGGEIPILVWTSDSRKDAREWFPAVLLAGLSSCTAIGCIWLWVYWQFHWKVFQGISPRMAILILVTSPATVLFGYLTASLTSKEQFRLRAKVSIAEQTAGVFATLALLALLDRTPETAMLGYLLGLLIGVVCAAAVLRGFLQSHVWRFSAIRRYAKPAVLLGLSGQLGNVATFFNYRLDFFIVNYFLNPEQVGLYAVGVVVSEGLWQIPNAAAVALLPRTARTIDRGASEFTCLILRHVLIISSFLGVVMGALSPLVIPAIFGARFHPSVAVIIWILPGTIALALGKVMSADLAARAKPGYSSIFALFALGVTVVLDFTLIPRMGIRGAALASSIAYFTDSALLCFALKRELNVKWNALLLPTVADLAVYSDAGIKFRDALMVALRRRGTARS